MTLKGSGVSCWLKYAVNSTKCGMKISFTEKHVDFLKRLMRILLLLMGCFPWYFISDSFIWVKLFKSRSVQVGMFWVSFFCFWFRFFFFFIEIKSHTSVYENLVTFRKKFKWKFSRFCSGLMRLLFHTGTEVMKYRKRLVVYVLYLAVAGSGTVGNLTRKACLAGLPVHLATVISL